MNSTDRHADITEGARRIADLESKLARAREEQDTRIVEARRAGAPWSELVSTDGRSRQMLNRVYRAATG